MVKQLQFKSLILLLAMFVGNGNAWADEITDVLNQSLTGITGTTYSEWSGKTSNSEAVYAGQSAGGNSSIQLRSSNSNSGVVTTASGGTVKKISVSWNSNTAAGRVLNVYGKNTAYSDAADLYGNNAGTLIGTIEKGKSTELTISGSYTYIGFRSASGAMYLSEVDIVWDATPTCDAPTFSPAPGTYTSAQNVTISTATKDATIYYTIDGTDPTTNSAVYSTAITVNKTTTIKAIAVKANYNSSVVATAEYTIVSIQHEGTQSDPYTVEDARVAIDAGIGVNGMYATGIVSKIVTTYNSTYSNITFDFVDNEGDTNTLRAYRCSGEKAAGVKVGDIVLVTGNLTKYGTTYEFGEGCELVSLTHPVNPTIIVNPATVNIKAEGANGTLTVTYENITDFDPEVYFCNANGEAANYDWIDAEINSDNNVDYVVEANTGDARTAYMKVSALDGNTNAVYSNLITFTQAKYIAPTIASLPFSFDGGKAAIEETDGLTANGLGSDYASSPKLKFDSTDDYLILYFNERPGKLTFDIKGNSFSDGTFTVQTSENGVNYTTLETYTELNSTLEEEFENLGENVRYIKWVYTDKANGNVALGNITLAKYVEPVIERSITVTPSSVNVDADEHDGTLALSYENLPITSMTDFDIQYYNAEGQEISEPEWIEVLVAEQDPQIGEGYVVSYYMVENSGEARTAYFKVYALDDLSNVVYSNVVTVTQAAPVTPATVDEFALFSGDLVEGDYIICGDNSTWTAAMKNTIDNSRLTYETITPENDVIVTDNATIVWHISKSGDYWTIYSADADAYAASTGAKNKAQMLDSGNDDKALWTVSVSSTGTYDFVNKANDAANVNAYLRNNGTYGFACYAESTGGALTLYKKVVAPTAIVTAAGWATFIPTANVEVPQSVNAYIVTGTTDTTVELTEVMTIPANEPVVLHGEGTHTFGLITDKEVIDDVSDNKLEVSDDTTSDGVYVLANHNNVPGFYKWAGGLLGAGRVYLPATAGSRSFLGFGNGTTTGIEAVNNQTISLGECFDLQGRHVAQPTKGLYIMNGKKVVVK